MTFPTRPLPVRFADAAHAVFGPSGFKELRGRGVKAVHPGAEAAHPETGYRLRTEAEQLTGVTYL